MFRVSELLNKGPDLDTSFLWFHIRGFKDYLHLVANFRLRFKRRWDTTATTASWEVINCLSLWFSWCVCLYICLVYLCLWSVYMYAICLSICMVCLYICIYVYLYVCLYICYMSVYMYVYMSVYMSAICLSKCLFICLSTGLSVLRYQSPIKLSIILFNYSSIHWKCHILLNYLFSFLSVRNQPKTLSQLVY